MINKAPPKTETEMRLLETPRNQQKEVLEEATNIDQTNIKLLDLQREEVQEEGKSSLENEEEPGPRQPYNKSFVDLEDIISNKSSDKEEEEKKQDERGQQKEESKVSVEVMKKQKKYKKFLDSDRTKIKIPPPSVSPRQETAPSRQEIAPP
jgi:hypothetical protein